MRCRCNWILESATLLNGHARIPVAMRTKNIWTDVKIYHDGDQMVSVTLGPSPRSSSTWPVAKMHIIPYVEKGLKMNTTKERKREIKIGYPPFARN